jgi:hypothetical protein
LGKALNIRERILVFAMNFLIAVMVVSDAASEIRGSLCSIDILTNWLIEFGSF